MDPSQLQSAFTQTLAPNPVSAKDCRPVLPPDRPSPPARGCPCRLQELIKQAEAFLKQASTQPGYGIAVLRVSTCPRSGAARPAASVAQPPPPRPPPARRWSPWTRCP